MKHFSAESFATHVATGESLQNGGAAAVALWERLEEFSTPSVGEHDRSLEKRVRGVIAARRKRELFFDADLFADPAWDMLLELYAAELAQQRVSVSSLCIAAAVPATTALRWIRTLGDRGLIVRRDDPRDARRVFISLTEKARVSLDGYFNAA